MIGSVAVGGGAPISVQSMTKTDTGDADATLAQIAQLASAGCQIIRVAVPSKSVIKAFAEIASSSPIPVIADIHFDYRLAIASIEAKAHAVRINPGNIGGEKELEALSRALIDYGIPVRIGANSGSLSEKQRRKIAASVSDRHEAMAAALVDSALEQCRMLERFGVEKIKVSLKASSVLSSVIAYRRFSRLSDYPLHVGITEAGSLYSGIIKSSVGIGALLLEGIGDTLRVSLSADPLEELRAAIAILEAAGLRRPRPEIVSCPTCGRTKVNLLEILDKVEKRIEETKKNGRKFKECKIAIMGCAVNGPGEASDADLGIAGASGFGAIFKKGVLVNKVPEAELLDSFFSELEALVEN